MLTGTLVRLRAMEPSDARSLWRWNNDREVVRWLHDTYPESLAHVAKRSEERIPNGYSRVLLGIEPLDEQKLIGIVQLRDAQPENGRAELDIYIGERDYWNNGYGTDAMRVICRYGFDEMRLHLIALWVVADNVGARRVHQKVGFVEDGRHREAFRRNGEWQDLILMSLLEGELID